MQIAAKLDEHGKGAWIAVMVLGFIIFWPIGLGILAYLIGSGRMACWKSERVGRWHYDGEKAKEHWRKKYQAHQSRRSARPSTDNRAFDEYREETLRRLEEEQAEFDGFLDRLRHAEDKAQFEKFMDERRSRPTDIKGDVTPVQPDDQPPQQPNA